MSMRFGVVGWGLRKHLPILMHRPEDGFVLAALADPSEEAQADFKSKTNDSVFLTADYRDLLDKGLDALFILSPDWLHEEQAIACLQAGVPVYLEKPMAITVEGCDRILEAAKQHNTKLYVGHNMRHFGMVRKMREWIQAGYIGEVKTAWCRHFISYGGEAYYRDWHADRTQSTGLLLQKGAHDIDVLHWLCGGYAKRVTAMGSLMVYGDITDRQEPGEKANVTIRPTWPPSSLSKLNPVVDVEDVSMMLMELDNGVLASYQQCHFAPDAWRNYTIIGSRGRIENFGDAPGSSVVRLWETSRLGYAEHGDLEYRQPPAVGPHGGSDQAILDEFVNYLTHDAPTDTSPIAARMAVAAGFAATESLRNDSVPVEIC
ncbi:MAG: Gfo/Idh/MocA family oxidoreductase [Fimbriimonadaceae bacterium]|nr:Gfo/Idh/MocA family oxidoreductase [Fimbriimonadaceae bacterium]